MSAPDRLNARNPTVKRILKEAAELASNQSSDYHAEPLGSNLFEWHFTVRGPPAPSSFAGGLYHGRIVLPMTYPLRPPSFRFLTPSGRFEVNREICLSISGHHEESWQPAWGIRTALVAIRSFMDTEAKGQVGGLDCGARMRKSLALESSNWVCQVCGKSNADIIREREEAIAGAVEPSGQGQISLTAEAPLELRLEYRDEIGKESTPEQPKLKSSPEAKRIEPNVASMTHSATRQPRSSTSNCVDMAILLVSIVLLVSILKKFASHV